MAALRYLAKTCNCGQYLETVLHDQFVCGLCDEKYQQELLSIQGKKEAVSKETQAMR